MSEGFVSEIMGKTKRVFSLFLIFLWRRINRIRRITTTRPKVEAAKTTPTIIPVLDPEELLALTDAPEMLIPALTMVLLVELAERGVEGDVEGDVEGVGDEVVGRDWMELLSVEDSRELFKPDVI